MTSYVDVILYVSSMIYREKNCILHLLNHTGSLLRVQLLQHFFNSHHGLHLALFVKLIQMGYHHDQRQVKYLCELDAAGIQSFVYG